MARIIPYPRIGQPRIFNIAYNTDFKPANEAGSASLTFACFQPYYLNSPGSPGYPKRTSLGYDLNDEIPTPCGVYRVSLAGTMIAMEELRHAARKG